MAWRGRQLKPIRGFMGRPTTDFAREGLFNLLNTRLDIEGADVLDLFAGTGMIGLGCASRGAGSITLVEKQNRSCKQIKEHFMSLGYERAVVVTGDCFSYIQKASSSFDFVFGGNPQRYIRIQSRYVPDTIALQNSPTFAVPYGL